MPTLTELRAAREQAGREVIALRDQGNAEGFVETPEYQENWTKANAAYNAALAAEEAEVARDNARVERQQVGERIAADADRIVANLKARFRPDYDPRRDARATGSKAPPTAQEWGTALRTWIASTSDRFDPSDEDFRAVARCKVNLNNQKSFYIPHSAAHTAMISHIQEIMLTAHPSSIKQKIREAFAVTSSVWQSNVPESAGIVAEPPRVLREVEINMLAWGGLLQVCDTITTPTGEDITLPTTDDTTVKGRRIGQNASLGTKKNPIFGEITWGAYKYTSDVMAITFEMTRDDWFDLEGHIGTVGGERNGRIFNDECTSGTGAGMPAGIVTLAPIGQTTAANNAITSDEIIDLEHSVDPAYRNSPTVGYMFHDMILAYIRKLKDGEGRPLYILGQETGAKDRLNNRPVFINQSMVDAITPTTDPMLFGEYKKYRVRRVNGTRIVRDPYTELISNDRELFAVLIYGDGNLINASETPTTKSPVKKLRMKT